MQALEAVVQRAKGPLLIEPGTWAGNAEGSGPCRRILVPLDGSPVAELGLSWAQAIARHCRGTIGLMRVVHIEAVDLREIPEALEREWIAAEHYLAAQQTALRRAGFESWRVVAVGLPASVIAGYARAAQIDLVVMTTCGRSAAGRRRFGRVCAEVVRRTSGGVLLIPPHVEAPAAAERPVLWVARLEDDRVHAVRKLPWPDVERALREGWNPGREGVQGYHRVLAGASDCGVVEQLPV